MSYMNLFYYMFWLCENYGIDDEATKFLRLDSFGLSPLLTLMD